MSLPDGAFPRVNAAMIQSGKYLDMITSVVGMPVSFDGDSTVEFECVDGGRVPILVSPEFIFVPGKLMEIMGAVQADNSIQVRYVFDTYCAQCTMMFL
jgi:DNA/RNA endonuclease YhcR with UshA esterase domain